MKMPDLVFKKVSEERHEDGSITLKMTVRKSYIYWLYIKYFIQFIFGK